MTQSATVIAIHVGHPQCFDAGDGSGKPWTSGIVKKTVAGPIRVGRLNLDGDQQADLVHHGGPDKAVLAYPARNYEAWRNEFPSINWQPGSFGENLTLAGVTENDVCIGDVFGLGNCLLQVSQPRQPCWKLSRRWNLSKLAVRVQETRLTGWYLRVLEEGTIETGQPMRLIKRPHPRWTVLISNEIMFAKPRDNQLDQELAACPALSSSWHETLCNRALQSAARNNSMDQKRLFPKS